MPAWSGLPDMRKAAMPVWCGDVLAEVGEAAISAGFEFGRYKCEIQTCQYSVGVGGRCGRCIHGSRV